MCLIKDIGFHRNGRPLIADKDIVCYKKLQQIGDTYFTPHTHVPVPIKCIRNKVPFEAKFSINLALYGDIFLGSAFVLKMDLSIHSKKMMVIEVMRYLNVLYQKEQNTLLDVEESMLLKELFSWSKWI